MTRIPERTYRRLLHHGDLDALIQACDSMCHAAAYRWASPLHDHDDLVQEARIGALRAARSFDPARNDSFGAWAWMSIRNQVLDRVRVRNAKRRAELEAIVGQYSLDTPTLETGATALELLVDEHADPCDVVIRREELATAIGAMRALTPGQNRAMRLYVLNDVPAAEVGPSTHAHVSRARRQIASALQEAA